MNNERKIIDSVETLEAALASLKEAGEEIFDLHPGSR